jgi:hypothetical protein
MESPKCILRADGEEPFAIRGIALSDDENLFDDEWKSLNQAGPVGTFVV